MTRTARTAAVLGAALLLSYAYFYQAGGWNQNSRFALVQSLLEQHSVRIDPYAQHTGDRALWQGHYYSDKAPGESLMALLPTAAANALARAVGIDPDSLRGITWSSYVATVATAGLFTMLAALAVFWLSVYWGASRHAAVFAATAYGIAGPAWCYATLFMGHGVTAGCLMIAFAASVAMGGARAPRRGLALVVGVFCGLAVLSEYPAAVPVLFITVFAVATAARADRRDAAAVAVRIVAAGAVLALVLMAYNRAAFGSAFQLGYANEDNSEGAAMQQGLFGITHPTLHVAYEVLFGSYRGLLPLAPLVVLTPVGLWMLARTSERRRAMVVAALVAAYYIILNMSYRYWEGGWAYAPRQLTPALPFLALGLAPLWDRWRRTGRMLLVAGWVWGAAVTLVAVSTTPQPPSDVMSPVTELLWPAFREGDLSLNHQSFVDYGADPRRLRHNPQEHDSWNLGEVMKLRGLASLLPLGLIWAAAAWALRAQNDGPPRMSRIRAR
jgi:hypothetical protein